MNRTVAVCAALLLGCAAWAGKPGSLDEAEKAITAEGAYTKDALLSSPQFEGRLTGSPGFEKAARWAAAEVKRAGLEPPTGFPDYLQPFPVRFGGVESARMELLPQDEKSGQPQLLEFFKDYMPLLQSASGDVTAEVVFAGFGITAPELGRDDYASLDVKGKIVMVLRGEPKDGRDWGRHVESSVRAANAMEHGAGGFLLADQPVASPNGAQIPGMPMADIGADLANTILSAKSLKAEDLKKVLEAGGVASFPTGRKIHYEVKAKESRELKGCNVVAVLPGSDRGLASEYLLVGAHLDHCGVWPVLLPGADDNASGSSALMEIARAASGLNPRPRRALVFVFFGGEEMGLLGSRHFAANPPEGLGKCMGVFNIDMVGAGNGAYVSGGKNFPDLMAALEGARDRREPGLKLVAGLSSGEPRADHGPFQKAGIRAVSLFGSGGSHHGYHTGDDTVFFVTPRTMEAVARVVLDAAVTLANEKK
jgi:hypothetical protein